MKTTHFRMFRKIQKLAAFVMPLTISSIAFAAYPERPITLIIPYGPGGGVDTIARLYEQQLGAELGQPLVLEYKPGAGGSLAASYVARAESNGYTLMLAPTTVFTIIPNVRKVSYDPGKDFTPITTLAFGIDPIIISKSIPANTITEFIELAKNAPGKYSWGSSGPATSTHLMGEMLSEAAGIELLHVPYKSSSEYLPDVIEGRVSMTLDPALIAHVNNGSLKLIGLVSDERLPGYPDTQTTREAGLDMSASSNKIWYGLVAPAGLDPKIVDRLNTAIAKVSQAPHIAEQLALSGMVADTVMGDDFVKKMKEDTQYHKDLIDRLGLRLD